MCISAFAVVKRGSKVLAGVPKSNERWMSEWISGWIMYSREELAEIFQQTILPSTYLLEGEHPDDALRRIMHDQLGLTRYQVSDLRIFSYDSPSDWYPGNNHWDLAFVYDVKTRQSIKKLPWWSDIKFVGRKELRNAKFGWNDDLMRDLKLSG